MIIAAVFLVVLIVVVLWSTQVRERRTANEKRWQKLDDEHRK